MLRFLRVRNFALIDQLELHFEPGLNLLSGETGAGKSILVDALGLLAGTKASTEMIRTGEARAVVEAVFEGDLRAELDRLGLDAEGDQVIVRREIATDGRNRVYINNQPGTVAVLKELAPLLLDIHGQHEQQTLLDPARQLELIDTYADATGLATAVAGLYAELQQADRSLAELEADYARRVERLDLLNFQAEEIRRASPKPSETEDTRERLAVLTHTGKLLAAATRAYETVYDSEASVTSLLGQTERALRDVASYDRRLDPLVEQTAAVRILVQDLAYGLRDYAAGTEADPGEVERLQSRLAELEKLHRKYGPDLIGHLARVQSEIDSIGLSETQKNDLAQKISALRARYDEAASTLSRRRRSVTKSLEKAVVQQLRSLAMPNTRFEVHWTDVLPGRASGIDRAELRISANTGEEARALEKIASGGELSRIMLSLRTVLAVDRAQKTLVFDEVDAGIGGKAAETVGQKLQELSANYQILCVTHLAQIAAFADHHYRIEKVVHEGRTVTRVEPLSGPVRIDELARMMSGSRVTDAARQHIRELLASSAKPAR